MGTGKTSGHLSVLSGVMAWGNIVVSSDTTQLASLSDLITFSTTFCGSSLMSTREHSCPSKSGSWYDKLKSKFSLNFFLIVFFALPLMVAVKTKSSSWQCLWRYGHEVGSFELPSSITLWDLLCHLALTADAQRSCLMMSAQRTLGAHCFSTRSSCKERKQTCSQGLKLKVRKCCLKAPSVVTSFSLHALDGFLCERWRQHQFHNFF